MGRKMGLLFFSRERKGREEVRDKMNKTRLEGVNINAVHVQIFSGSDSTEFTRVRVGLFFISMSMMNSGLVFHGHMGRGHLG